MSEGIYVSTVGESLTRVIASFKGFYRHSILPLPYEPHAVLRNPNGRGSASAPTTIVAVHENEGRGGKR